MRKMLSAHRGVLLPQAAVAFVLLSSPAQATDDAAQRRAACNSEKFKIAVDVGHTAEAQGATSARGIKEYEFNLKLAKEIEATLKDAGFVQTHLLITHGTGRSQLFPRPVHANAIGVDLFVSIHHNDVQDRYHDKWEFEGVSRTYSDTFSGYSLFISNENKRATESLTFARLLGKELRARGLNYSPHQAEDIPGERHALLDAQGGVFRYDQLFVLKETNAPAVLVEAGIIVNRNDELVLASPERRALITAAMVAAAQEFCGMQQRKLPSKTSASSPRPKQ
jgi:N-acetylmuramoyl-L-alanine amidase